MGFRLFLSVLFFSTILKAQNTEDLKAFINKNNIVIKAVQKNMIRENNNTYILTFKEILKNQEAAIKLYSSNRDASSYYAALVRSESLLFLTKHAIGSITYFEITESEKSFLKSNTENQVPVLSAAEIKKIEELDAMNIQGLNNLPLTIQ